MKRQTVTLCMIARDEEASIGLTIKSVLALVDEIIVVDTGSQDNTRIIAEGYGARVIDMPWQDNFAATRNAGLAEATSDWILVLDADERLQPVRPMEFQRLLAARNVAAYKLKIVSPRDEKTEQVFYLVRLFRNRPQIRYQYPIHEQIIPAVNDWAGPQGFVVDTSSLTIVHEGYRQNRSSEKRERNLRILRKAIATHPDEPYFDYQMACEMVVLLDDEVLPVAGLQTALASLEKAWEKARAQTVEKQAQIAYGPDLVAKLGACRLARGDVQGAREVLGAGRKLYGEHPAVLLQSIAATAKFLRAEAKGLDQDLTASLLAGARHDIHVMQSEQPACLSTPTSDRFRTLYPLRYLGELALLEGRVDAAAEHFEQALTRDCGYSFAWLGLAECARYAGDRKRALKLYLRTVTENEWNHEAWLRGSSLLEELGFHDNAVSWRRKVGMHFPEHPTADAQDDPELRSPKLLAVPD